MKKPFVRYLLIFVLGLIVGMVIHEIVFTLNGRKLLF